MNASAFVWLSLDLVQRHELEARAVKLGKENLQLNRLVELQRLQLQDAPESAFEVKKHLSTF